MTADKLRQQIVFQAARLMFQRQETEYAHAKVRAARAICRQRLRPSELPTNREIREELQRLSGVYDSPAPFADRDNLLETLPDIEERFRHYRNLLTPLSKISQDRRRHPEGDVLYHSLQVYTLTRDDCPYDEELLLAALLHDVGKGIDPFDHLAAGLEALGDSISERTCWFIENMTVARGLLKQTIGIRARRRLQHSDDYEALIALAKCDVAGRIPGAVVPEFDEALAQIRELAFDSENESSA